MRHANIITVMLLIVLSSSSITNTGSCFSNFLKESSQVTPEKITSFFKDNHALLTEEVIGLEVTLHLWHEKKDYDKELWHKLAHIFLNLSLVHDSQNLKSIYPFFLGEPYRTMLNNYTGGKNGILAGLEIKGDYTNSISFTLFSIPAMHCRCLKRYSPNYSGIACTCQLFKRIKDDATIYYDDVIWQHTITPFISYMENMYMQALNTKFTIATFLENINPLLKETIIQINEDSGIHGFFKVCMYDHEAEISLGLDLQKNDSLVDEDIFKSTKILNLDCATFTNAN